MGHESRHQNDLQGQLEETLCNIESLLDHARQTTGTDCGSLNNLSTMKIYIRHAQDYGKIKCAIEERVSHKMPALYLQADICRNELLVEIEAIGHACGN